MVRFYADLHVINAYLVQKQNVKFDTGAAAHPESVRHDAGFEYTAMHHKTSKSLLDKVVAIVELKLKPA